MSATFLQPFLPYTTKTHTTLTLSAEATYNWEDSQWSVPLNLSSARFSKSAPNPLAWPSADATTPSPDRGPDWGLRAVFTLLFPTVTHGPSGIGSAK
jgi:hypothetical protein